MILAVLAFVFSAEVKAEVIQVLRMEGLVRYRDDMNLMNLIDWFQKTVSSSKKGMGMQVNMVNGLWNFKMSTSMQYKGGLAGCFLVEEIFKIWLT